MSCREGVAVQGDADNMCGDRLQELSMPHKQDTIKVYLVKTE